MEINHQSSAPHPPTIHLPLSAIEQHINQFLLSQAHSTQALQVVALRPKPKHCNPTFRTEQRQSAYSALRMYSGIQVISNLPKGLGSIAPALTFEINQLGGHAFTIM
ncbi:hypothetical protein HNO85_12545 [Pseudomonas brassicacearum]|uniref:Uncharacterized protein n=1 Tax=Pseudomonas brassicacearum TaxID=930166 RepID=A0AAJ3FXR1_9PSED|nr:hypothetical protein [Pseudomonas brassicacearum]